jgi:Argonaute siRNA chaperone (ARC) complex subunit Arb1
MFSTNHEREIKLYSHVIRNFLNYVLHHHVCPEYTDDVMAARKICDLAEKELWAIKQLQSKLPGDFNIAASTLHGGRHKTYRFNAQAWSLDDPDSQDHASTNQNFTDAEAERIFKTAVAFAGDDALFMKAMNPDIHITTTARKFYEVAEVERPSLKTIAQYARVKNLKGDTGYIKALGVVRFKNWEGPALEPEDFTDDEDATTEVKAEEAGLESFWLEDEVLEHFFTGLKLEVEVHELNIGIKFFDTVLGLHCSFHTYLPNEKMIYWKEPGMFPPPRCHL